MSPVISGLGFYIPVAIAIKINMYLFAEGAMIHILTMQRRKCTLQLLEWTSARLDWWLADDSDEEFALDDAPTLLSLRANTNMSQRHKCDRFIKCELIT